MAKLILILLLCCQNLFLQEYQTRIDRISLEHGLSQSTVNYIYQDRDKFLWFATQDGLNKYDGKTIRVYRHKPGNPLSISNNNIRVIYEDSGGDFWVGTYGGGLNRFNRSSGTFSWFVHDPDNPNSISGNNIFSIFEDRNDNLWIGTWGSGLNRYNKKDNTFKIYQHNRQNKKTLSSNIVRSILQDSSGQLWIGTYGGGLNKYNSIDDTFSSDKYKSGGAGSISSNKIMCIFEDYKKRLWVATDGGGLNLYNRENESFSCFVHDPVDPNTISHNRLRSIFEDKNHDLWIGTYGGGISILKFDENQKARFTRLAEADTGYLDCGQIMSICGSDDGLIWIGSRESGVLIYDAQKKPFITVKKNPDNPNSLSSNQIRAILEDKTGDLWLGTNNGGLNRFDIKRNKFTHFNFIPGSSNGLSSNRVYTLLQDRYGTIWVGTFGGGLNRFNPKDESFTHFRHRPGIASSLSDDRIRALFEDRKGRIWVGTWGGGLNRYDPVTERFTRIKIKTTRSMSFGLNEISAICDDPSGQLWLGTYGEGVIKYDPGNEYFRIFKHSNKNKNSLSNNKIFAIYADNKGRVWIATNGGGLNCYIKDRDIWVCYRENSGLPNDIIYGILAENDKNGLVKNLWLSSNKGLTKFTIETESFRNYDITDGLQSNEFNAGAYYKNTRGEMFFGGINGFNIFHPSMIKDNSYIPPIRITEFRVFNNPVRFSFPVTVLKEARLSYSQNFFSLEFVSLSYRAPEKNQYMYKLDGFDKDWINSKNRNYASYTNLDGGTYIFRVRGSNNDGIWNSEGLAVRIIIAPPFTQTIWFKLIIISGLVLLTLFIFKIRIHTIRKKHIDLEKLNLKLKKEIRERHQVERELKESEKKFRSIFENSIDAYYRSDKAGNISMMSPSGVRLLGYRDSSEVIGKNVANDLYLYPARRKKFLTQLYKKGKLINYYLELKSKSGKVIPIETSSRVLLGKKNQVIGVEGIFRNISKRVKVEHEKKILQHELIAAQKLKATATLAEGMAHEFNNLMAIIIGNVEMIRCKTDNNDILKRLDPVMKSANRCSVLTNQLLSFSRKQSLELANVNVNDLILLNKRKIKNIVGPKIELDITLGPDIRIVRVDPELLGKCVFVLVTNAWDAISDTGSLSISTKNRVFKKADCHKNPNAAVGEFVVISVADTGTGMNRKTVEHIFDPFFTTKKTGSGTGLGLSFVYGTIMQHKGWINVVSSPGEGALFELFLPVK